MKNLENRTDGNVVEQTMYIAPQIEVLEIEVEKGFALSQQEPSPWEDL